MKRRERTATTQRTIARGFAVMSALFLLIVMALLGAFMVNLSVMQAGTSELSLTSSRVYYGARSGLEWGIHQAVAPAAGAGACSPSSAFALSGAGLTGVNVAVTCAVTVHSGSGGSTYYVYFVSSTASYGTLGGAQYAERRLTAQACRSNSPTATAC